MANPTPTNMNLYGIGVSPLSISNKEHSLPEELLANKEIGLFAIAGSDKNVISAEYIGRCKRHIENFVEKSVRDRTLGKIYQINIDENLARTIIENNNLFVNELSYILDDKPFAIRFDVDLDYYQRNTNTVIPPEDIRISIDFILIRNGEEKQYNIEESITVLNDKAFRLDFSKFSGAESDLDEYEIILRTFEVKVPEGFNPELHTIALYEILFEII